MIIIIIQMDLG